MTDIFVVVDDGYNTSYIDSVIMALFYKFTNIDDWLNCSVANNDFYYIQELIKYNFVDKIRRRYSISSDILNEIRNYCVLCGWKQYDNIINLFKVSDFYNFLIDGIGVGKLYFNINDEQNMHQVTFPFIDVKIDEEMYDTSIDKLLQTWINTQLLNNNPKNNYNFNQMPIIIPIYFDRTVGKTQYIDIMKKIRFHENNDCNQKNIMWEIYSVICYSELTSHYYTIIHTGLKEWHMYDSALKPSIYKIHSMTDENFVNKIKQECVFVVYKLENSYC